MTETSTLPETITTRRARTILAVACGAQFMVVLDATIVNVALPSIGTSLELPPSGLQWVINAYVLGFAGFLLFGGRAADLFGRRRVFLIGLSVFTAASIAGGLAQTGWQLIAARALQGLGAAVLAPSTLTLLTTTFREQRARLRALAVWSAVAGSGGALGGVIGGLLTGTLGWRWVFFVNGPIGAVLLVGAAFALRDPDATATVRRKLDLAGTLTVTSGLTLLVYGIVATESQPLLSTSVLLPLLSGVALLMCFVLIERRSPDPLVPLSVFRIRSLTVGNILLLTSGGTMGAMLYFLTLHLQDALGYTPLQSGLAMMPGGLAIITASFTASRAVSRFGVLPLLVIGPMMTAAGLLWLSAFGSSYVTGILLPMVLTMGGMGLTGLPLTMITNAGVPHAQAGLASGIMNTSRQVGGAVGLAVIAAIAAAVTAAVIQSTGLTGQDAITVGYGWGLRVAAVLTLLIPLGGGLFLRNLTGPDGTRILASSRAKPARVSRRVRATRPG